MGLKLENLSFNTMQNSILEQAKVDHDIRQVWFSTRKKKRTWFFTFVNGYVFWIEQEKILISQLTPPKFSYLADQNGRKLDPMKMNFGNFQIQKRVSQTVRAQKVDEKYRVICLNSIFLSWVMVLKLLKIVEFCKFLLTSARNLNILKQFIFIHLKDLIMLFQKIVLFS